jgi:hypothetical protein
MPAPFQPDPADRRPEAGKARGSSARRDAPTQSQTAPQVTPGAGNLDQPTVISGNRAHAPFDPASSGLAGRKLGHFELIESVGRGGMAAVLKARDLELGRVVALKILPPEMAADPENIVRFKQEARAAARLDHENVARVYTVGEDQGLHFIAFEFVEGDNLRQVMSAHGGSIPVAEAVPLMLQVAAGLGHAAERGVVHRDIKPSNILVTPDGRAKIVDMGLARNLDPKAPNQLTESGVTLGTFDYISPEQAVEPRSADVRSDIYSLGCTFYHALTGHLPVPEGNAAKKLDAQMNVTPPDPRKYKPELPADLVAVLKRMMVKDPDRRYQDPTHLAAHLRTVAKRLGLSVGPLPAHGPVFEDPLATPFHKRVLWTTAGVAAVVLIAGVLYGIFRKPHHEKNDNQTGPVATNPNLIDPIPPGPTQVAINDWREAKDEKELVALLDAGATHIRLTGTQPYDLVKHRLSNGHPPESVLAGENVDLEGVGEAAPRVLIGFAAYGPEGKARPKTLTVRGPGNGKGSAIFRGIRFVVPDILSDTQDAGLVVTGFGNVTFEGCTFARLRKSIEGDRPVVTEANLGAGVAVVMSGGSTAFDRCYFAPGAGGLAVDGPGRVDFSECALGPEHAAVRVVRPHGDTAGTTEMSFTHCSALLPIKGSLVELGEKVPCLIRAALCLFAGPDRSLMEPPPVIVRQRGDRADDTAYQADPETGPNGYYNVSAYADDESTYTFAEAATKKLPVRDIERRLRHPWDERDPFARLNILPKRAFLPNLKLADLRVKDDPKGAGVLGTRFLAKVALYDDKQMPAVEAEARDRTVKIWDPKLPDDEELPQGVYPTLARALADIRRGDTLFIRHTGPLEVDPQEFTKTDFNVTIKPEPGSKPILVPAPAALKRPDGLFKLYAKQGGGRLVLDGLHFKLPAGRAPAVAVLPGGGQLEIRNCVITMEDGEDLSAVSLLDPRGEMMMGTGGPADWPSPKVTFENVFVRGKGHLVDVKGSRPFDLDVKNTVAALDKALINIDPTTADPSAFGSGNVRLNRVTTYLGGSVVHIKAAERKTDTAPFGLAKTELTATQCVFAPAGSDPLVRTERLSDDEQVKKWLGWHGKDNVYGYDKKSSVLEIRPPDADAMPPKMLDPSRWPDFAQEETPPFAAVKFPSRDELPQQGDVDGFLKLKPSAFVGAKTDPPRADGSPEVGASADVPGVFGEE